MNIAVRPRWVLPHLALSGLTAAVVAASSFGTLGTLKTIDLSQLRWGLAAPDAAPQALPQTPPAPPFVLRADAADMRQAVRCLGQAVYFEAGFQPVEGKRAVAQVIVNRVRDRDFPQTVCGVVYQGARRRTGCQFSFTCDGSLGRRPPSGDELASAEQIAREALSGYVMAAVGTATHYHTWKVDPYWNDTLVKTAQIGDHIFYRWPGKAGQPSFLHPERYAGNEIRVARQVPKIALA